MFECCDYNLYIWVIDKEWNQHGCWILASFFFFFFFACLWTSTPSRSINTQKLIMTRPISCHLDRTSLVNKRFIIWTLMNLPRLRGKGFWSTQRVLPSGQDSAILSTRVANHTSAFGLSRPLTELAIYNNSSFFLSRVRTLDVKNIFHGKADYLSGALKTVYLLDHFQWIGTFLLNLHLSDAFFLGSRNTGLQQK